MLRQKYATEKLGWPPGLGFLVSTVVFQPKSTPGDTAKVIHNNYALGFQLDQASSHSKPQNPRVQKTAENFTYTEMKTEP